MNVWGYFVLQNFQYIIDFHHFPFNSIMVETKKIIKLIKFIYLCEYDGY